MPVYEYQCQECGVRFEKLFLSIAQATTLPACPQCNGVNVHRLLSIPAIHTGEGGSSDGEDDESEPAKPPIFGRKELQQAMETKARLREEASEG